MTQDQQEISKIWDRKAVDLAMYAAHEAKRRDIDDG
jgi:hypothetical protein